MADNGKPSTDPTVAWDDIGGVAYQRAKLSAGKDGEIIGDVGGRLVDGDANRSALYVTERSNVVEFAPTITGSTSPAYSVNDCLGGLITVTNAVAFAGNALRIHSLFASATVKVDLQVYFFNASPAGTFTDNAAFPTLTAADRGLLRLKTGLIADASATVGVYYSESSRSDTDFYTDIVLTGTSLYMALLVTAGVTLASTTEYKLVIGAEKL